MINIGGLVSVGGSGGGSGGGSSSGIQSINSQTGPAITINGVNGTNVLTSSNIITIDTSSLSGLIGSQSGVIGVNGIDVHQIAGDFVVDGASLSGLIPSSDGSGINAINGDIGPNIDFIGVNGIEITAVGGGQIIVDGAGASGSKYAASFSNITSGQFIHGLGTRDIIVQIFEESPIYEQILPDRIILDSISQISLLFNQPQSGRVVILK